MTSVMSITYFKFDLTETYTCKNFNNAIASFYALVFEKLKHNRLISMSFFTGENFLKLFQNKKIILLNQNFHMTLQILNYISITDEQCTHNHFTL